MDELVFARQGVVSKWAPAARGRVASGESLSHDMFCHTTPRPSAAAVLRVAAACVSCGCTRDSHHPCNQAPYLVSTGWHHVLWRRHFPSASDLSHHVTPLAMSAHLPACALQAAISRCFFVVGSCCGCFCAQRPLWALHNGDFIVQRNTWQAARHKPRGGHNTHTHTHTHVYVYVCIWCTRIYGILSQSRRSAALRHTPVSLLFLNIPCTLHPQYTLHLAPSISQWQADCSDNSHILSLISSNTLSTSSL
jgi:hypothetical protein